MDGAAEKTTRATESAESTDLTDMGSLAFPQASKRQQYRSSLDSYGRKRNIGCPGHSWPGLLSKELETMRNLISMAAGAAFVVSLAMPAFAADMTVKGEVVDVACSVAKKDGGKGAAHANCAMVCAKKGQPVGILTADAIYTVTGDYASNSNAKLLDFVAKTVEVSGDVTEKDGQKMIAIKSIKLAN